MSAFRKRPAAYQMFGTELSRRGQIAEMGGKTRLDVAAKVHLVPFTPALVAFVRGSDDWEGEYHHVARSGNPHYVMPFGSAEEWNAILPAWREAHVVPPVLKRAAVKARALGMSAKIVRQPDGTERGGFKGFLLVRSATAAYYAYADGKVTGGLSSQPEGGEQLRAALFGPTSRTQNPKPRSTRDKAILLHRWMDRQEAREGAYDAKHAYKHKAGTPEHAAYIAESSRKRRVAHAARLKVAALNQELGQGMAETTRMVRGLGHSIAEHRRHNPLRISNKRPATMSAKAINAELDALEAEGTRFMHEAIAAGRGHERPSDRAHMTDPLSMATKAVDNRMWELRREVEQRYGRWTPRLPETRMFGAREKA